jgi:hypothetical protein
MGNDSYQIWQTQLIVGNVALNKHFQTWYFLGFLFNAWLILWICMSSTQLHLLPIHVYAPQNDTI